MSKLDRILTVRLPSNVWESLAKTSQAQGRKPSVYARELLAPAHPAPPDTEPGADPAPAAPPPVAYTTRKPLPGAPPAPVMVTGTLDDVGPDDLFQDNGAILR